MALNYNPTNIQESRCLLGTYVFCVIVLIGCMIGGIALAASGTQLVDLKTPLKDTMSDYDPTKPDDPITQAWDDIQEEYECCGVDGAQDWTNPDFGNQAQVPASCCANSESQQCLADTSKIPGCYSKFEDIIKQNEDLIYSIVSITLIALVSQ